ncbi:hypothetical protein [Metalysinibacillus jejuensis]|uniref:hypothetical protein n=1 Tax=Metalysinibacillus jejuensis TaxID=914327 RepID=UPI000D33BEF2|nr:hypothetical protein [Metalysinibacillus jejuensis]
MKKLMSTLMVSSLLLVACSEDQTETEALESKMKVLSTEEVAELEEKAKENEVEADPITQEQAEEFVGELEQRAKNDDIIKQLEVKEGENEVDVTFAFSPNATEQQRNEFFFNYSIFIQKTYPDKKINYHEEK